MLMEAAQAVQQAAQAASGNITIAIPTAFISSALTLLGREALAAILHKKKGGNGGPKPGEGKICDERGKSIGKLGGDVIRLQSKQESTDKMLDEVRGDVKELLRRVPKQ